MTVYIMFLSENAHKQVHRQPEYVVRVKIQIH